MTALTKAYKLIFERKPPADLSPTELVALVGEGFSVKQHGVDLALRCLDEIHQLTDALPHQVYSDARRSIYGQLPQNAPHQLRA